MDGGAFNGALLKYFGRSLMKAKMTVPNPSILSKDIGLGNRKL